MKKYDEELMDEIERYGDLNAFTILRLQDTIDNMVSTDPTKIDWEEDYIF